MKYVEFGDERIEVTDREETILRMRTCGFTLSDIGEVFGISRERIRQIEARIDPDGAITDALRRERVESYETAIVEAIETAARENPSHSVRGLARAASEVLPSDLRVSEAQVVTVLGPEAMKRRHVDVWDGKRDRPLKYTEEQVFDYMRKALKDSGKSILTTTFYKKWEMTHEGPSSAHITQRFGTWNQACEKAGIPHGEAPANRVYVRRWTPEKCLGAVIRFIGEVEGNPSAHRYDEWSRGIEDAPSMAMVRVRLGKWSEILKSAYAKIEEV